MKEDYKDHPPSKPIDPTFHQRKHDDETDKRSSKHQRCHGISGNPIFTARSATSCDLDNPFNKGVWILGSVLPISVTPRGVCFTSVSICIEIKRIRFDKR